MKNWCFCFLLLSSALIGKEFHLKERVEGAKAGDYVVTEANKMITLLAIRSITPHSVVLEEISAPAGNLKKTPCSWSEWVKAKAPGHTSWSMIEIDLKTGQLLECYSFTRASWIQLSRQESLFATLLQLPLKPLDLDKRRRIGPPPTPGEEDHRKEWNPPLVYEGKKMDNALFEVFETVWPQDGTELAGKSVSLYFDQEKKFPLPYWIQIDTAHAVASMRTIDAGKGLSSPYRSIPRRVPQFIGTPQKTETGLRLSLKSPKYYREFELFAIDITTREKQIYPIIHSLVQGDGETLSIEIDHEELKQNLEPDHRYTWLIVPSGHSEFYTESIKPFVWSD
ncbi:MAG TPA: hypothetical protein VLE89_05035 [Chlamydiales bacterium]|nr:hypothetical protein [Chlamydiales bacterium]